jgi:NitT/TauT family transport system substrate-binding protein
MFDSHGSLVFAARRLTAAGLAVASLLLGGCGENPASAPAANGAKPLFKVDLGTDWVAQAEHGGFYQAVATGRYAQAGLDVNIIQGGPGVYPIQSVATNRMAFGMTRSDEVVKAVIEHVPLVIVCAYLQHDPLSILLHEENPVSTFKELDGKTIMTTPGAYWIGYAEAHYGIHFNIQPMNYSLAQFLSDKNFIQQCYVTNEPFYARRAGAKTKTILLSESGYDPYRVIFTSKKFAREHPEVVRAFVAASIAGWEEYINVDPKAGNALIRSVNNDMPDELLTYAVDTLRSKKIALGDAAVGDHNGLLRRRRLQKEVDTLLSLQVMSEPIAVDTFARFDFLPAELQPLAEK